MGSIRSLILPDAESRDPAFREEVGKLSVTGLRIIALVGVGANVLSYLPWLVWFPELPSWMLSADALGLVMVAVGFGLTFWRGFRPHARWAGLLLLFLGFSEQILAALRRSDLPADLKALAPVIISMALLLAATALPVKPLQTFALGTALTAVFFWASYGPTRYLNLAFEQAFPVSILAIFVLMATVLTAIVYQQRVNAFGAKRTAEKALEALREAQGRILMSETAVSQNRFAAALCHELNTPLGALSSAFATLLAAYEKAAPKPDARIAQVIATAADAGRASVARLEETVARMKYLTNLDRSEVQVVDLNRLWQDTVHFMDDSLAPKVSFVLDLSPIPEVSCRPQQLAAVFANLVQNAAAAIATKGTIRVRTFAEPSEILMEVQDDGCGIAPSRLANLFEPGFRSENGRVSASNWGLFVSRGIVTGHGGRIEVESEEGKGTVARIRLPVQPSSA
ncbi:MAG TPA: HAMP domain-containing sensor histidine kinase [Vicinamibacteria bacterium]|nr:HAMP domain-containing sensor histidine kinase [Vicinamibacteria bacterium]